MPTLLEDMRDYLCSQSVIRKPSTPNSSLPPCFLEPRDGAPAPGSKTGTENHPGAIVSAYVTGGVPHAPYESFLKKTVIDFHIRTRSAVTAYTIEADLRKFLSDRRGWTMGSQRVEESMQTRPLSRVGSDSAGYLFTTGFMFETTADDSLVS